jgi:hypothetical protein
MCKLRGKRWGEDNIFDNIESKFFFKIENIHPRGLMNLK